MVMVNVKISNWLSSSSFSRSSEALILLAPCVNGAAPLHHKPTGKILPSLQRIQDIFWTAPTLFRTRRIIILKNLPNVFATSDDDAMIGEQPLDEMYPRRYIWFGRRHFGKHKNTLNLNQLKYYEKKKRK